MNKKKKKKGWNQLEADNTAKDKTVVACGVVAIAPTVDHLNERA